MFQSQTVSHSSVMAADPVVKTWLLFGFTQEKFDRPCFTAAHFLSSELNHSPVVSLDATGRDSRRTGGQQLDDGPMRVEQR